MNRWSEKNRIKTQFGKNPMDMETWESLQLRMHEIEMYEQRRRKDSYQEWVDDVTWNGRWASAPIDKGIVFRSCSCVFVV